MRRPGSAQRLTLALSVGIAGLLVFQACVPKPKIKITSPAHGIFTLDTSVVLSGTIANIGVGNAEVRVNGTLATLNPDKTWSVTVALDTAEIMNGLEARLRDVTQNRIVARDRILVHYGDSRADGAFSAQGVALRLTDPGLDQVEPIIESGVDLDLATLVPVDTVLINNQCFVDAGIFGCWGRATVTVVNPPPSISGFAIDVNSQTDEVDGDITVNDAEVNVFIDGSGLVPDCGLTLTADSTFLPADYTLQPDGVDPSNIDVNLQEGPYVSFSGFDQTFTSGACDDFLIGDIIQLFIGDLEDDVTSALQEFLDDDDGAGPMDSPLADAIETALAGISITGPLSESLGVSFEAPLFAVTEDVDGITLGSDARITASIGTDPGQCTPPEGSPDLAASFHVDETFPTFGPTTPVGLSPYHLGLAISSSAFNQLLKAQVECGLLRTSITEVDLGEGPVALTAGVLGLLIPEFQNVAPETPMRIDIFPTLAPFVSGSAGPGGEIAEIQAPHLRAEVRNQAGYLYLAVALDFKAGLGITFDEVAGALAFTLESVAAGDITVSVVTNPINTNVATLQNVLPGVIAPLLVDLGAGLGAFPLPSFLGLQLGLVEVSRTGDLYTLYADLTPSP